MHCSSWFLTAALVGTNIALVQRVVEARLAEEVGQIAKAITLEIKAVGSSKSGSGILLQREGDVYTVLTAGHVVNQGSEFTLKTSDGQIHRSIPSSVKLARSDIDLGILKFKSTDKYALATIGRSSSLKELSPIYVAGFPESTYGIKAGTINITEGRVIGNATKGNATGYSLIYSNNTFRGMSGGPVLNETGELVAIHGQGDRDGKEGEGEKTGRNLGIVVERFGSVALSLGVHLDQQTATLPQSLQLNASDYFLRGLSKADRGDFKGAIADYDQAISLNPTFANAHNNRALLKVDKLNDVQGALSDYNQAISLDPKSAMAYNNRGILKDDLNDVQGALSDYNQAIFLNPKRAETYYNRALLKNKLNDVQGALSDYNQAISLNPNDADAYNNRSSLKYTKLKDRIGAIQDLRQAAVLYREQVNTRKLYKIINILKQLGVTER
jgi:tetratricopeptide (TPR) repeat protein